MNKEEFVKIRKRLKKTQREIAKLLGISYKTVESYEQGNRNIPKNAARLLYFLLFKLNMDRLDSTRLCWEVNNCPPDCRDHCVAWLAREGVFCWFLTCTSCLRGKPVPKATSNTCHSCDFFKENLEKVYRSDQHSPKNPN
ncbi:MAG: helix-turn-helix transcriptional regulator [Candidatus Aminicenantes bacterium]|nr:helix-turn-helix transcriptional regulator [Candidatus Aminicenantes bacterium]